MVGPNFRRAGKIMNKSYAILIDRRTSSLEVIINNEDYMLAQESFSLVNLNIFGRIYIYHPLSNEIFSSEWSEFVARCQSVANFRLIPMENVYEITIKELLFVWFPIRISQR